MSANVEWDVAQTIVSPYATLELNQVLTPVGNTSPFYMVRENGYSIVPAKFRPVSDSISQADGASLQPPYIDGMVATLEVKYYVALRGDPANTDPACGQEVRLMHQQLMGVLNSLRAFAPVPNTQQRYLWTPTGDGDRRMITQVLLASWPVVSYDGKEVTVTFQLASPFPYAISATEIDTVITSGGTASITNRGNAAQSPVIRVAGPTSSFVVENMGTGLLLSYTGAAIGVGHYAEIDMFRGTIYEDGNGADLIDGLDPTVTDFWLLEPGTQTIASTGGVSTVLSNPAWV